MVDPMVEVDHVSCSKYVMAIIRFVKGHAVRSKYVLAIIRFVKGHAVRLLMPFLNWS